MIFPEILWDMVTKKVVAGQLLSYLHHKTSLTQLVDWAENTLLEANFSDEDMDVLTQVLARLGLADIRAFGLSWEDCEDLIHTLGYRLDIQMREPA